MKSLSINRQEAEQLWIDDNTTDGNNVVLLPEVAEMEKKAKQLPRHYVVGKQRKASTKERKVDYTKKDIMNDLQKALPPSATNISLKNELELSFTYNSENYTLKLTRHRAKKG